MAADPQTPSPPPIEQDIVQTEAFRHDPYPTYRLWRQTDSVRWIAPWGCWGLTRRDDVIEVLSQPERFSNRSRVTNIIEQRRDTAFLDRIQPLLQHFQQGLINVDPPEHTRLRRLLQKAFSPRVLRELKPRAEQIVDQTLSQAAQRNEVDLIQDLAFPLPVTILVELLGVDQEMSETFKRWSKEIIAFQAHPNPTDEVVLGSQEALLEMREFLRAEVERRRGAPRRGLLDDLIAVEESGARLTVEEILSMGVSLLVAGHETTTHLIGSSLFHFMGNSAQKALALRDEASLANAVEEVLRFESPIQRLARTVTEDCAIRGQPIPAGSTVLCLLGAANRDPEHIEDPDSFDVTRPRANHQAFGHGVHFCIGAALARLEAPIAIAGFFDRFPGAELTEAEPIWESGAFRGLQKLPVRL